MKEIWCNGRWLPATGYPGSALDRGAFLGLGLFETMLALDGRPVFAERHLARITDGCTRLGWEFALPDFREIVAELLVRNHLGSGRARVRMIVTAGSGPHDDLTPGNDRLVWISASPAAEIPDNLAVCVSPWPRNERSPLAGLKSACYAENLIALDHARRLGFQETIFLNTLGHVCETATANLFMVKNDVLLTPSLASGCLPGIGRDVIIELAGREGIAFEERQLAVADLESADGIFLSSSTRGPVSVSRFGGKELPPEPLTAELRRLWNLEIRA